jgi:hypothetical protein
MAYSGLFRQNFYLTWCRELWRLNLSSWEWDELTVKGGPSARSGHRMLCHKGMLYVFGGFHDTGVGKPKYYADLWAFSLEDLKWESLGDVRDKWPAARSAYQWVVHNDQLVMHGGYTKEIDDEDGEMEHGRSLGDTWSWHLADHKVCPSLACKSVHIGMHIVCLFIHRYTFLKIVC